MKITLSIATYERIDYVERMSASLLSSVDIDKVNVRIYDDCSPSLSIESLHHLFPYAKEIIKREQNLRADANMKQIFEDFLQTEDDVLLLADSDLIYRSGWFEFLEQNLPQTDGILSLYDSRMHHFVEDHLGNASYSPKKSLGAAGVAFTRARVRDIVSAGISPERYDWAWSHLLSNKGYRLMCATSSYIQHIGVVGQNNRGELNTFDFSCTFVPNNEVSAQINAIFMRELIALNEKFYHSLGIGRDFLEMREYDVKYQEENRQICKKLLRGGR